MLQKLSIVTGILVVLGGVLWFTQNPSSNENGNTKTNLPVLAELDSQKLASVEIQAGAQKIELTKDPNGIWLVRSKNYVADPQAIRELLLKLVEVRLGDPITENAKHHERFRLVHIKDNNNQWDEEKTGSLILLKNQDGSNSLELILGKDRDSGEGQYVRYADDAVVYLLPETISLETEIDDWLDTSIADVDGEKLAKSLELKRGETLVKLDREKEEADWTGSDLTESETIEASEVDSLSSALKDLNFAEIAPADKPAADLGRETLSHFTMELFDGRIYQVSVGEKQAGTDNLYYYLAIQMDLRDDVTDESLKTEVAQFNKKTASWLYGLSAWVGKRFLKERTDLIKNDQKS